LDLEPLDQELEIPLVM
jgi:hypothetical protein